MKNSQNGSKNLSKLISVSENARKSSPRDAGDWGWGAKNHSEYYRLSTLLFVALMARGTRDVQPTNPPSTFGCCMRLFSLG